MTTFYLGTTSPHWLRLLDIPLCVSRNRLARYKTPPQARGPWLLDSGGFTELQHFGLWRSTPAQYIAEVRHYCDEVGQPVWVAPQDWMCEPVIISGGQVGLQKFVGTHLSVAEHQRRTVDNYLRLRDAAPDLPFAPVVQGYTIDDYLRCVDLYAAAGVDLTSEPTVGLGSVCRREATGEIGFIVSTLAAQGLHRLHGFGVKIAGLAAFGHLLASADSQAWSQWGRREPPCTHGGRAKNEAHCLTYALDWRRRVIAGLHRSQQLPLPLLLGARAAA